MKSDTGLFLLNFESTITCTYELVMRAMASSWFP